MKTTMRVVILAVLATVIVSTQARPMVLGGRSLLHAHNAYPEEGQWPDRIDRALATGQTPIVIEQDVTYTSAGPHPGVVVSHDTELDGREPTLQAYFFDRVRPLIEGALAKGDTSRWPLIVLHLDFKTNDTAHHRALWDLLKRHEAWLTTAPADSTRVSQFKPGPLLVLTENGADQEQDFSGWAAAGGSHLIFGSIPGPAVPSSDDSTERARLILDAAPSVLVPASATSYRRWVNFAWAAVEEGGPAGAADWNARDERRLASIVDYAHAHGLLVRFYTLNGHDPAAGHGWTASYNFGSLEAVRLRWRAAIKAGVDLIATDQYEELAAALQAAPR